MSESYYKEKLPELIDRLKKMVDNNMDVIDQKVEGDISEDKFFNVLKGRKQAADDCLWAMKRIDELENELNGVELKEEKQKSWAKTASDKKK